MTKEETGKDGGASGNIQELECGCCSGCCGIPVGDKLYPTDYKDPIGDVKDPTEEKSPP